jgi:hypothetical protein
MGVAILRVGDKSSAPALAKAEVAALPAAVAGVAAVVVALESTPGARAPDAVVGGDSTGGRRSLLPTLEEGSDATSGYGAEAVASKVLASAAAAEG